MIGKMLLRLVTVEALVGRTLAGENVQSSLLAPINELQGDDKLPVVAVFTDVSRTGEGEIQGRDMLGALSDVTLGLEMAVFTHGPVTRMVDGQEQEVLETGISQTTDEGYEMTLDLIERQAIGILQAGTNQWAEIWRAMTTVKQVSSERGASADKGVKWAGRRVEIVCEVLPDPAPGRAMPAPYEAALAALTPDYPELVATIRDAAGTNLVLPDWQVIRGELGLTEDGMRMTGDGPFPGGSESLTTGEIGEVSKFTAEDIDNEKEISVEADDDDVIEAIDGDPVQGTPSNG